MFEVGKKVLIRTVTYHALGEITAREGEWVTLKDASWIANSSEHFGKMITEGTIDRVAEVEYVGEMAVNLSAAVDAFPWAFDLPKETR